MKNVNYYHYLAIAHLSVIEQVISTYHLEDRCKLMNKDDLLCEGYIALYHAAESFDENKGSKFATYAFRSVHNTLITMIHDAEQTVLVPRSQKTMHEKNTYIDIEYIIDHARHIEHCSNRILKMLAHLITEAPLDDRERWIVQNKYDINLAETPMDTHELARQLQMTPQSVNRICRNAIDKIKSSATA